MKRPFIIKELNKFNPDGVYGVGNQPVKTLLFATEEVGGKDVVVEMKISDGITAYKDLKNLLTPEMPIPTLQSVMEEGNTSSVAMYITGSDNLAPLKDGLLLIKGGILSLAPTDNPTDPTRWQLDTLTVDGEDVGVQLSASTSAAAESALQIRKQSVTQAGLVAGSGAIPKGRIALADAINDNEAVSLQQMNAAIALESTNLLHKTGDETKNGNLSLGNEKVFSVSTNTTIGGQVRATNLTNGDFSYMSGRGFVAENQTQAPSKRTQLTKDGVIFDTSPIDNFKQTLLKGSNIAPSSNITISLPNQTGTLALTTDIPSPIDLTPYQLRSEKGQPNGYASLDGNANILLSQIPDTLLGALKWGGTYDGSTIIASSSFPELNGQALPDPADYEGVFFVSTANYTQSGIDFQTGDWIIAINSSWGKVDNTDAVTSVNGRLGAVTGLAELEGGNTFTGGGQIIQDSQPTVELKSTLFNQSFKLGYFDAVGNFEIRNHQNKKLLQLTNPISSTAQPSLAIGNFTGSIPAESQLYVYGGQNGANIDARGRAERDEANIDLEGSDWATNPNSLGFSYYGINNTTSVPNTLGYIAKKLAMIRFNEANNALIVSNNQESIVPIRFGINNVEIANISDKGWSYQSDFASVNSSNPRWMPDKAYVDGLMANKANTNASNINVANYKAALNISDGSTLNNNISGTAAGATTWAGVNGNFNLTGTTLSYLAGMDLSVGQFRKFEAPQIKTYLGLPSTGGYDLQSVTDRGNVTTNPITINSATATGINFQRSGSAVGQIDFSSNNLNISASNNLLFQPSGGNVGIGTTSPSAKLDVTGSIRASSNDGDANSVVRNSDVQLGNYVYSTSITLNLGGYYTFNGTTATWTLPVISGNTGRRYLIMNQGTGTLTINTNSGGNDIYMSGSSVNMITIGVGEIAVLYNNSLSWFRQL